MNNGNGNSLRQLLQNLRGGGFNASLTLNGVNIVGQKVVVVADNVVYTVNNAGLARAALIDRIDSVDF